MPYPESTVPTLSLMVNVKLWWVQGFAGEYVAEYIKSTGVEGEFNVGEYWADLK